MTLVCFLVRTCFLSKSTSPSLVSQADHWNGLIVYPEIISEINYYFKIRMLFSFKTIEVIVDKRTLRVRYLRIYQMNVLQWRDINYKKTTGCGWKATQIQLQLEFYPTKATRLIAQHPWKSKLTIYWMVWTRKDDIVLRKGLLHQQFQGRLLF